MCDLIAEISKLKEKARRLDNIESKVADLTDFIDKWDSKDETLLPICHNAKINLVRNFVSYVSKTKITE